MRQRFVESFQAVASTHTSAVGQVHIVAGRGARRPTHVCVWWISSHHLIIGNLKKTNTNTLMSVNSVSHLPSTANSSVSSSGHDDLYELPHDYWEALMFLMMKDHTWSCSPAVTTDVMKLSRFPDVPLFNSQKQTNTFSHLNRFHCFIYCSSCFITNQ